MKNVYVTLFLLTAPILIFSNTGIAPSVVTERLVKYDFNPEKTIRITAQVGGNIELIKEDIDKIKSLKIHHIDLVYTSYKGSKSFDQEKLNRQRIAKLKSALPQVRKDEPTWKYIEQSGAKNAKQAKEYFHGFVIHYGHDLSYDHLKRFFKPFQTPPETFVVNGKEGGTFNCGDGSTVDVPANAVTYADGTPVKGSFSLKYKDFKDPADIVFSGIPMTYDGGSGEDMNFSPVGMYDVRAVQNGKELKLDKPVEVDFKCTKVDKGVDFYEMDDKTGKWTKKQPINFKKPEKSHGKQANNLDFPDLHLSWVSEVFDNHIILTAEDSTWMWFEEHLGSNKALLDKVIEIDLNNHSVKLDMTANELMDQVAKTCVAEKKAQFKREAEERKAQWEAEQEERRKQQEELRKKQAEISAAGQTIPELVSGLRSPDFGVFNCDQVYRIEKPLKLAPNYKDENGNVITGKHVACVMDLTVNGSLSFHPNNITCNGEGKNVILLFTDNKDVYMLSKAAFDRLHLDGSNLRPDFNMKNMTGIIKTSDDLKKYLG